MKIRVPPDDGVKLSTSPEPRVPVVPALPTLSVAKAPIDVVPVYVLVPVSTTVPASATSAPLPEIASAIVTVAITAERLAPAGERVARAIGAVCVGAGLVSLARATGLV